MEIDNGMANGLLFLPKPGLMQKIKLQECRYDGRCTRRCFVQS